MALHRKLQRKVEKKKGKRNAIKNAKSALLKIPVELLRNISDELSLVDKIILGTTCRPIRNTLGLSQLCDSSPELHEQRFDYLARVCRDMPGKWVCDECICCHDIDVSDTPATPRLACPVGDVDYGRFNRHLRLISRHEYRLGRRHIQLALKYTRLGNDMAQMYQQYLRRLMTPRQYSFSYPYEDTKVHNVVKITPRVINGRFFLKSIFEYRQSKGRISRKAVAHEFVCQHQDLFPEHDPIWVTDPLLRPLLNFHIAVGEALGGRLGHEVRSHCPHCFTDFSVKASAKSIRFSLWQDLGTESSALDPVWKAFVYVPHLYTHTENVNNQEPGRVRELYGEEA